MKTIIINCIKKTATGKHYTAYLVLKDRSEESLNEFDIRYKLIAPCNNEEEAKNVGMNYNSIKSGLPPYTFKTSYSALNIVNDIKYALIKANEFQYDYFENVEYEIIELSGYDPNKIGTFSIYE